MWCDQLEMQVKSEQSLEQAGLRIIELEESLTGKQTALNQLLVENEELKSHITLLSSLDKVTDQVFIHIVVIRVHHRPMTTA